MRVAEMRMLRWKSGMAKKDKIRKDYVRSSIGLASVVDKMRGNKLRRFGRVMRREKTVAVREVMKIEERGRGRRKKDG